MFLLQTSKPGYPTGTHLWIGGNDIAHPGEWVWSRGDPIDDFNDWIGDADVGDCLEVVTPSPRWRVAHCNDKMTDNRAFVAERSELNLLQEPQFTLIQASLTLGDCSWPIRRLKFK